MIYCTAVLELSTFSVQQKKTLKSHAGTDQLTRMLRMCAEKVDHKDCFSKKFFIFLCCRLYYSIFKERYGVSSGKLQISQLKEYIEGVQLLYQHQAAAKCETPKTPGAEDGIPQDSSSSSTCIEMEVTQDNQVVIALCSPFMRRVHRVVKHSAEMVFCDASGNMDRSHCRVFLLLTHSCIGGLPLGVLITTNEGQDTIQAGLKLLVKMVGSDGFFGRGHLGPNVIMTDDCKAERSALQEVFPSTTLLLCVFHVLQAFWRYLWDSKTGVRKDHRSALFMTVKRLVYSSTQEELHTACGSCLQDPLLQQYPKVAEHIKGMIARKQLWAVCLREELLIRGNDTNNFCERAMRVLKDQVLNRTKAFNIQQLIDFIFNQMETFYERKCCDVANNILDRVQQSKYLLPAGVRPDSIVQVGQHLFEVQSEESPDKTYHVDMSVGLCTCKVGCTGGPCKHQAGIVRRYNLQSWNFVPEHNSAMRQLLCYLGTGVSVNSESWFQPLKCLTQEQLSEPTSVDSLPSCAAAPPLTSLSSAEATVPTLSSEVEEMKSKMSAVFLSLQSTLQSKLDADPEGFLPICSKFIKNFETIKTESHLTSALCTFGLFYGKATSNKRITVQPTALQRRQRALAGCRRRGVGRPSKETAVHAPRAKKARHNLAECVSQGRSLGKTHSQK